eukprot:TRINITY_DN6515_c0_g3_i3.p1 TRINITY_DN6515_c0_g3~~TRINITY_DN6515_c0_g3_i3.p1  ORF type:complete len:230 (+),score=63.50 TRINITY_DN6515_c0_g3_i3:138-827(+)
MCIRDRYNYVRTGRMVIWGCCSGTMCALWYPWLGSVAVGMKLSPMREVGFKLFFDQMLFQQLCINSFFAVTSQLEGKTLGETKAVLQNKVLPCWMAAVPAWSAVQFVNFRMVPVMYQPFVVYIASLAYNTGLSLLSHAKDYGTPTEQLLNSQISEKSDQLLVTSQALLSVQYENSVLRDQLRCVLSYVPPESMQAAQDSIGASTIRLEAQRLQQEDDDKEHAGHLLHSE